MTERLRENLPNRVPIVVEYAMEDTKLRRFVVLIDRDAMDRTNAILSGIRAIVGVEISAASKSSIDITADETLVDQKVLEEAVRKLGGELHAPPEAQLMDPIPTKRIP